jgi:hypothetical protein
VDQHSSSFLLMLLFRRALVASIVLLHFGRRGLGAGLEPQQKISP